MRLLLIGDFSGFGLNLKKGLEELGHSLTIAVYDSGWKKFDYDIKLSAKFRNLVWERIFPYTILEKLTGYDVVLFMDPFVFYKNYFPRKRFYNRILNENKKSFLIGATMDSFFWKHSKEYMMYTPYDDMRKHDWTTYLDFKCSSKAYEFNDYIANAVDGIIPVMYDYEGGYKMKYKEKTYTIPLPLQTKDVSYTQIKLNDKLIFSHGISRYGFKGTEYVDKAFQYLSGKYPNDIEWRSFEKIPFKEYMALMTKTDIIVDQVNSYSYGMNALYSMASGKIVMSGAEKLAKESIDVKDCPIVNIRPNVNHIIGQVENLLDTKDSLPKIGAQSRAFVKKNHEAKIIAQKYIDLFEN